MLTQEKPTGKIIIEIYSEQMKGHHLEKTQSTNTRAQLMEQLRRSKTMLVQLPEQEQNIIKEDMLLITLE